MNIRQFGPEAEAEYAALMAEACLDPVTGDALPTAEIGHNLVRLLLDAEQAQRSWATAALRDDLLAGAQKRGTRWLKAQTFAAVQTKRGVAVVTTTRGIKAEGGWQQEPFAGMTWAELRQVRERELSTQVASRTNVQVIDKLLALAAKFPDAATPGDACACLGLTVEQYLEAESAA